MTGRIVVATRLVAGVDEAGRGPLAGPVVAAAVILDPAAPIAGLADSKVLPRPGATCWRPRSAAARWRGASRWPTSTKSTRSTSSARRCWRCAARSTASPRARRGADRRQPLPAARVPRPRDRQGRPRRRVDLRRVDPREDRARRDARRARRAVPGVRLRAAQGISDAGPPRGAGAFRAVPRPPAQLRAGGAGRIRVLIRCRPARTPDRCACGSASLARPGV